MSFSQFNIYPTLTPVRVASTANIAGTYYNGPLNNGLNATLTIAASSLTVDGVLLEEGDRVLLQTQTNTNEQGIYVVSSIGSTVVLERSADQQSVEQLLAGQNVAVAAGSVSAGNFFTLVEPLPDVIGVDAMVFNADPSAGGVAFSGGASTANAIPVFSNASGDIKAADAAPVTLGQNLSVTGTGTFSGALSSTAGNITSGSSGDAGTFISFPATAANGTFIFQAVNAGGAFNTTIASGPMTQSTVYTVGDIGAATGGIPVATGAVRMKMVSAAAAAGGSATQNIVDAFCTAGSVVIGFWNTSANAVSIQKIVPGAGSFNVISSADAGVGTFNYMIFK